VSTSSVPSSASSTESSNFKRLQARLRGLVGKAIADFSMIAPGDRVMVCLSGGKDSYTLLDLLLSQQRAAPVDFELVAVNLDQKQPGFPEHVLPDYLKALGVPFRTLEQDTYSVVKRVVPEGRTQCGLCSRLRRGALYRYARENGIDKIALGHHRDDIVETLFLNLFHAGRLKAMAPKLLSEDGRNVVIRPLCYVPEREIVRYARARAVARMLAEWEKASPGRIDSIFHALCNVQVSQLVDPKAFDFASLVRSIPGAPAPIDGGAGEGDGDGVGGEDGAGDRAASDPARMSGTEVDQAAADDARAEAAIRGFTPLEDWRERATLSPD
jgi:tRNA 2-thiocytidine biosynthesis protein TtcA